VIRKPIFDAVRDLLGRGFSRAEVEILDRAIDQATGAAAPDEVPYCHVTRTLGEAGAALIKRWESCARRRDDGCFEAYPDPGSADGTPWTIGWGSTGPDIGCGTVWTQEQCDVRFERDVGCYVDEVARAIGSAPTTQNQFDALVSFHYNTGRIAKATLTRKHCAGDHAGAQAEFGKWVFNDGRRLRGLVRRRAEEAELYGTPDEGAGRRVSTSLDTGGEGVRS
jgi:GH24 family phage-related lysozyme (muramidase)